MHLHERLKRKQKAIIKNENYKRWKIETIDVHLRERLCWCNKENTKKDVETTDIIPLHSKERMHWYNKENAEEDVEVTDIRPLHLRERLCLYNTEILKKQ